MDLLTTLKGSLMEGFLPQGWDLGKIDQIAEIFGPNLRQSQAWWHRDFAPIPCRDVADFDVCMGHEIAREIVLARDEKKELILILPVGPMGMYRWAVYFLNQWKVSCHHVHGFNMDEWSDSQGNTLPSNNPGAFQYAMEQAFYGPLGSNTVPVKNRHFALKEELPDYAEQINGLKSKGGKLVTVFGIGRVCHIAFWEPHFAADFSSTEEWKKQTHRIGAKLHPLTIEQNALTSFKSRTTLVPAFANTIGPGLFLKSDSIIGGADGIFSRGMQWQGLSLRMSLHHEPTPWIPSSFMPTMAGKLFYLEELGSSLVAECN
ncbi:MAG: glucosamine-6-phosphate isomerase [Gemmataceae bacterium]|nr:glucosamine-6-phosphate isomerase [Gemmataceae bacterium]